MTPRVSIIIVNWNGRHLLADCLSSLQRQTFQDFEILLVDNGSNDGSAEWSREHYPSVRTIGLPSNLGFCAPNNLAIRETTGAYVCLVNNDTELDSGCLAALVDTMDRDAQTGICDAKQLLFDRRNIVYSTGADYTLAGSTESPTRGFEDEGLESNRDAFIGMAACALYRRRMLDEIGLFDEDFFAGYEDVDISFRAHLAGYRVQNVGRARCYHKISATQAINSPGFVHRGQRNLHWVYVKNMPASLLRRYGGHHVAYTLATALYFFRIGQGHAWLRAKRDVWRSRRRLLEKRRQVQALKRVDDSVIDHLLTRRWLRTPAKREKMRSAWRQHSIRKERDDARQTAN